MQLNRGDEMNCGNTNEFRLRVAGQSFTYRLSQQQVAWKPVVVFTASIGPDGAFEAVSGTSYLRGTLKNGHMQGRMSGDVCGFTSTLIAAGHFRD